MADYSGMLGLLSDPGQALNAMNALLHKASLQSQATNQKFTTSAENQLNSFLNQAINSYNTNNQQAQNILNSQGIAGFNASQSLLSPYYNAGINAGNMLQASLGMTPVASSNYNDIINQQRQSLAQPLLSQLGTNPTLSSLTAQVTPDQINSFINQNLHQSSVNGRNVYSVNVPGIQNFTGASKDTAAESHLLANPALQHDVAQYLAQQQLPQATQNYNQQKSLIDALLPQQNNNQASPTQPIPTPADAMHTFYSSPQYQAMFGNYAANHPGASPTELFQNDPGFQYNMNQALAQVNRADAAKGLLESGNNMNNLMNTASQLQNQEYQTWLGQQNSLFNNWQNQLSGLNELGAQNSGASNAMQLGQLLGGTGSQYQYGTGQSVGQAQLGTGQDIASMLANLGSANASTIMNTAAAQNNNMWNTMSLLAQQNNAQQASNAMTQSSAMQGQGAMAGANALMSLFQNLKPGQTY